METPLLVRSPAPEAYIDAVPAGKMFLQTSPELCMKRMLAAGYPKIFQICKCFRAGERGPLHVPEFTMLEWYRAGWDYKRLMEETEELVWEIARGLGSTGGLPFGGKTIDLLPPWQRISVKEAFERHSAVPLEKAVEQDMFDEIMVSRIEPELGHPRPTFISDYPASMAALARTNRADPSVAERFEMYIGGLELANGFSELTDPVEQESRFIEEEGRRRAAGKLPYPAPDRFLEALAHMPEAAGMALGVDRLAMVFSDTNEISDVLAFTPEEL